MTALHQLLNISKQIVRLDGKAICLCQSMYKGFIANGNTNVLELYEV